MPYSCLTNSATVFVVSQLLRSQPGRLAADRLKLKIPILGRIFHAMAVSEFCRSLATLLAGGIPVVSALEVAWAIKVVSC